MSAIPDVVALSGGRKKRVAKKPAAAKAADKKKAGPVKKKGGALVDDMKNLAVPFAILLAQQGLKGMLNKKEDSKGSKGSKGTKKSASKKQSGGSGCSSCAATPLAGGASRYAKLSAEIDGKEIGGISGKKYIVTTTYSKIKSKTEYLTFSPWKLKAATADIGMGPIDIFSMIADCSKDNTEKYIVGGTGLINEGATKCDPSDPQTEPLTWAFTANETQLVQDGETFTIGTLDANTLAIRFSDPDGSYVFTYGH
jgi:hypothetical protein